MMISNYCAMFYKNYWKIQHIECKKKLRDCHLVSQNMLPMLQLINKEVSYLKPVWTSETEIWTFKTRNESKIQEVESKISKKNEENDRFKNE
jgi:hypothetical protein